MFHDLTITFAIELKATATKYLKKWHGLTETNTESVIYRSNDHFSLGLIDLVTNY